MVDTIHDTVSNIPANIFPVVAGYVTGTPDIKWTDEDWARFPASGHLRIDQSPSLSEFAAGNADVADIESGAASITTFIGAAKVREARGWYSWAYVSDTGSNFNELVATVAKERISRVQYWVCNPNLSENEAVSLLGEAEFKDVMAIQWAWPSTNPTTKLPGTATTLTAANADLSVIRLGWFNKTAQAAPVTTQHGIVVTSSLGTKEVSSTDGGKTWL